MKCDFIQQFEIDFINPSVKLEWLKCEDGPQLTHLIFYFDGKEAENMRTKLGLDFSEDEIELHYDGRKNIFPRCALNVTIDFIPEINDKYDFWVYSERDKLRMFFEYTDLSKDSFYKLLDQLEIEISGVQNIIYI